MERRGVRPELAGWTKVNRGVSVDAELPYLAQTHKLANPHLVRPESPGSVENRAQFALPTEERRSDL